MQAIKMVQPYVKRPGLKRLRERNTGGSQEMAVMVGQLQKILITTIQVTPPIFTQNQLKIHLNCCY